MRGTGDERYQHIAQNNPEVAARLRDRFESGLRQILSIEGFADSALVDPERAARIEERLLTATERKITMYDKRDLVDRLLNNLLRKYNQ